MPETNRMPAFQTSFRFQWLEVWQEGKNLYRMVSRAVRGFPREELFGRSALRAPHVGRT